MLNFHSVKEAKVVSKNWSFWLYFTIYSGGVRPFKTILQTFKREIYALPLHLSDTFGAKWEHANKNFTKFGFWPTLSPLFDEFHQFDINCKLSYAILFSSYKANNNSSTHTIDHFDAECQCGGKKNSKVDNYLHFEERKKYGERNDHLRLLRLWYLFQSYVPIANPSLL